LPDAEDMIVEGTTAVTYADNMYMTWRQSVTRIPIFIAAVFFGLGCVPAIFSLIHPDSLAAEEPVRETGRFLIENWKLPFIAGLLYLVGIQICSAACFWRLPIAARTLTYSADASGISFKTGEGSSGHMPWTTVRKATRTSRYVILQGMVGPFRFIALRAFSNPEWFWKVVANHVLNR
jgi:hypothetical protein